MNFFKNDYQKFITQSLILILFTLIFSAIDINNFTGNCLLSLPKSTKFKLFFIIIAHHLLATVANFAWLCTSKIILSIFIIVNAGILIHWLMNRNKCLATQTINKACGFPETRLFPDFFYILGFKQYNWWNNIVSYIYYFVTLIIGLLKLIYL